MADPAQMTRGERVIAFIEAYCVVPEGMLMGRPVKLDPFQRRFILAVYDNPDAITAMGILSMARKNGKTGLIACLLLAHIAGPEAVQNSRIVSGARSKDQAGEVFNYAYKMVMLSPVLSDLVRIVPSGKKLMGLALNVEYQAISAEGKTAHGKSPILAILDEVGQVKGPQDDFIDAIITAQGAYQHPLLLVISTQAPTDGDLLSIWIDDALKGEDPALVCHLYAADKDSQVLDPKAWKAANPAYGTFLNPASVEKMAHRASRMPSFENTFRNLHLNQRVTTTSPFISRSVWQQNAAPPAALEDLPVYAGLDLSAKTDLTALVLVGVDEENSRYHVHPYFWKPADLVADHTKRDRWPYDVWARSGELLTTPGVVIDYDWVAEQLRDILDGLNLQAIAFDRWRIDVMQAALQRAGLDDLPLVEWGQGYKDMSPAIDALEAALLSGQICHGGQPVLDMCAANAVTEQDQAQNRRLNKPKSTGRIDGMVALAMAMGVQASGAGGDDSGDFDDFINAGPLIV